MSTCPHQGPDERAATRGPRPMTSKWSIVPTTVQRILPLRELHRREMNCQIVHDSFAERGLSDAYVIEAHDRDVGYGLVANRYDAGAADEFFAIPECRADLLPMFRQFLATSRATRIRAQTNDRLLLLMLYDCATNINVHNVLFADGLTTALPNPGGALRRAAGEQEEWEIVIAEEVIARGGLLFHYNPPFGDIFMEVQEAHRQRGFGSYLVQELKRICYEIGKVPAARCDAGNLQSRRTLERAGMLPCARVLIGDVTNPR
jgi:GNAT superfamily N-acetyltransferase